MNDGKKHWQKGMRIKPEEVRGIGFNDDEGYFVTFHDKPTITNVPKRNAEMLILRVKSKHFDELLRKMSAEADKWGLA